MVVLFFGRPPLQLQIYFSVKTLPRSFFKFLLAPASNRHSPYLPFIFWIRGCYPRRQQATRITFFNNFPVQVNSVALQVICFVSFFFFFLYSGSAHFAPAYFLHPTRTSGASHEALQTQVNLSLRRS